ncbi:MAG: hypothetical protein ACRDRK_11270, partial [Pseudonocardia sp.]
MIPEMNAVDMSELVSVMLVGSPPCSARSVATRATVAASRVEKSSRSRATARTECLLGAVDAIVRHGIGDGHRRPAVRRRRPGRPGALRPHPSRPDQRVPARPVRSVPAAVARVHRRTVRATCSAPASTPTCASARTA